MGQAQLSKAERRHVRKALGDDATFWAMHCFEVIKVRGFWGRLRWLFLGT